MDWPTLTRTWGIEQRAAGRAPGTIRLRLLHLRRLATRCPDPLTTTRADLLGFLADLGPTASPEYRRSVRSSLVVWHQWLAVEGYRPDDPAARLPAVRVPPADPRPADDDDVTSAILEATLAQDVRLLLLVRLARECGLRCAEVAAVHSRDLELHGLRVRGKGGRERTVPIPADLRAAVQRADGWLFPSPQGGHLTPGYVGRLISRALPDGVTPHQLRHAAASAWHRAGLDLLEIRPLLGHASVRTTQIYVAVDHAHARAVVEAESARLHGRARRPVRRAAAV